MTSIRRRAVSRPLPSSSPHRENDVTGLFPPSVAPGFQHFFQHILIPRRWAQHADAGVLQARFRDPCLDIVVETTGTASLTFLLACMSRAVASRTAPHRPPVLGHRRTEPGRASLSNVYSQSNSAARFGNLLAQRFGMQCATSFVLFSAVRENMDKGRLNPENPE